MPYQVFMPVSAGTESSSVNILPNPTGKDNGSVMVVRNGAYSIGGVAPSGDVVGPTTSVQGHIATFNNSTGTLMADSNVPFPIPLDQGGTGATTAQEARANLGVGLGTGDVVSEGSSFPGNLAIFRDTTGDLIGDAGFAIPVPSAPNANKLLTVNTIGDGFSYTAMPNFLLGAGANGTIPVWSSNNTLANSLIVQNAEDGIFIGGTINVAGDIGSTRDIIASRNIIAPDSITSNLVLGETIKAGIGGIKISQEGENAAFFVTLKGGVNLSSDYSLTLPMALPPSGQQFLQSDTLGNLSFASLPDFVLEEGTIGTLPLFGANHTLVDSAISQGETENPLRNPEDPDSPLTIPLISVEGALLTSSNVAIGGILSVNLGVESLYVQATDHIVSEGDIHSEGTISGHFLQSNSGGVSFTGGVGSLSIILKASPSTQAYDLVFPLDLPPSGQQLLQSDSNGQLSFTPMPNFVLGAGTIGAIPLFGASHTLFDSAMTQTEIDNPVVDPDRPLIQLVEVDGMLTTNAGATILGNVSIAGSLDLSGSMASSESIHAAVSVNADLIQGRTIEALQGGLRVYEEVSAPELSVTIKGGANLASSYELTLPVSAAVQTSLIQADPTGALSFVTLASALAQVLVDPGSILYRNAAGAVVALPPGIPGDMLTVGTDGMPAWAPPSP